MSDAIFKTKYGPCKKTCIHKGCALFRYLQSHKSSEMWEKVLMFLGDKQEQPILWPDGRYEDAGRSSDTS